MKRPSAFSAQYWREEGVIEGAVLRTVFSTLLVACGFILFLDLNDMMQRSDDWDLGSERTETIYMAPPAETDHVRPYFPKAMPALPGSQTPKMPGLNARPTPEMVAAPMTFHLADDGQLSAVGRIERGTSGKFDQFLKDNPEKVKRVWLLSPGGSVSDAISMGRAIRKASLDTVVPENAYCASSCPLVYAGGVHREAGRKSWIGVHQVYAMPEESGTWHDGVAIAQQISAECEEHLLAMGVDPKSWIKAMKTSKDRIYIFTPEELTEFKIATSLDAPRV